MPPVSSSRPTSARAPRKKSSARTPRTLSAPAKSTPPKPSVPAAEAAQQFASGAPAASEVEVGLTGDPEVGPTDEAEISLTEDAELAPTSAGADRAAPAEEPTSNIATPTTPSPRVPRKAKKKKRSAARAASASASQEVAEGAPEPEAELAPEPVPSEPQLEPESVPLPEPESVPQPEPAPQTEPETAPQTEPEPAPEPEPAQQPEPEREPEDAVASDPFLVVDRERQDDPPASTDADTPALRLRGVSKSFGETVAVDAIDLTVQPGTFYGIVGPNGAGKTTTLSMATGLLRPDQGEIQVVGVDLSTEPARAKRLMGILPDRLRTFDRLTGRQLLHYYGVLRGLRPAVVESRVADLARAFDLNDALGRTVADYSAGMTKKVMLAGAMIHSPRMLVLDEPFEAVDPVSSAVILDILKAYVAHGGTVVLSSHGMDLVERVCSGVAVIVAGQVLAEGTVDEVRGELTLEQRFIELAGGLSDVEGLEWLHTFSG